MAMRHEVRKGLTQYEFNARFAGLVPWEIITLSIISGIYFSSWWVFILVLIGLLVGIQIPIIASLMMLLFSLPIGLLFFAIGSWIGGLGAAIVLGGLAYWVTFYVHLTSVEYNQDLVDK
jgi:hypothetical protein